MIQLLLLARVRPLETIWTRTANFPWRRASRLPVELTVTRTVSPFPGSSEVTVALPITTVRVLRCPAATALTATTWPLRRCSTTVTRSLPAGQAPPVDAQRTRTCTAPRCRTRRPTRVSTPPVAGGALEVPGASPREATKPPLNSASIPGVVRSSSTGTGVGSSDSPSGRSTARRNRSIRPA